MFIKTEETPNPNTLKFLPESKLTDGQILDFKNKEEANNNILATSLFEINGVVSVFIASEFISITKDGSSDWFLLKADILGSLVDYLSSNNEPFKDKTSQNNGIEDDEIVKQIKALIDEKVRPAVAQDGGDIVFSSFEEGILYLELRGACSGCPSAGATLKMGIENMMRHFIPEVLEVREAN